MTPASAVQDRRAPYRGKRWIDLALLAATAVPAGMVAAVCAVAVRATSRGPILFRQVRVGMGGRLFVLLKFRTMIDAPDNPAYPDPARITAAGRWLRRFSLDELPQLVNVARGEMSFVGPRPTLPYQVERYDERQRGRLSVRPGITGLAQVRGRNAITWGERIEHDLEYIDRQSPALDVRIIWDTLRLLPSGRGTEGHPTYDPIARVDDGPTQE